MTGKTSKKTTKISETGKIVVKSGKSSMKTSPDVETGLSLLYDGVHQIIYEKILAAKARNVIVSFRAQRGILWRREHEADMETRKYVISRPRRACYSG